MNEIRPPDTLAVDTHERRTRLVWLLTPLFAFAVACAALYLLNPLRAFDTGAPPVEHLTFERTVLDGDGIHLKIRAGGSEPMRIAQLQVDDAFWTFTQAPPGPLSRVSAAWLNIPYPWLLGEKHEVKVVTSTGTTFSHAIEVAVATPRASGRAFFMQAVVGAFVGIVPVTLGLMVFPALRGLGGRSMGFLLALTVGLLAFLLVDTLKEAIEFALRSAAAFQGIAMVLLSATTTALGLFVIGRRHGVPTGVALATFIALGIGLHNLGEGLAIGTAFAAGAAPFGTFLVLGFTLHNITEGIGIAVPLVGKRPPLATFIGLALLAGAPAIVAMWLGSLVYAPQWMAFTMAIAAGAILQVIVEMTGFLIRMSKRQGTSWVSPAIFAGFACGILVMYMTGMVVKI
jgi:zinc transporter ZupT